MLNGRVENRHGIIGRATPGERLAADDAWETNPAYIYPEALDIVIAEQFPCQLCNAVNGPWPHHRVLRCLVPGRLGSKSSDGARGKDPPHISLTAHFQDVVQARHVNVPS